MNDNLKKAVNLYILVVTKLFFAEETKILRHPRLFLSLHFDFWIGDAIGDDGENDWDWCRNAAATLEGHLLKGRYLRNNCQVLPVLGQSSNMKIVIKPDQKLWQIGGIFFQQQAGVVLV